MSDTDSQNAEEMDLSKSDVVTKYKAAAEIANKAIAAVIKEAKDGALISTLCKLGDDLINAEVAKSFKGKAIEKGVSFPTSISVNGTVGHFSPAAEDTTALKDGDLIKIDLGVHIDGFIATQASSAVVAADPAAPVTGRAADAIAAARIAFEAALRLVRPGKKVSEVAPVLQKIVEAHGCTLVEGVLSHQLKQFVIDGNKCVLNRPGPEHKVEEAEFEENEVYAIDIVVSTGEGKPRVLDEKETTIYKRAVDENYKLKLKASRAVFGEINRRFPTMPFALRSLVDGDADEKSKELAKQLRLGLVECLSHSLLHPYPVLHEKHGEVVAQVKATVLLMPNGSDRITVAPQQPVQSEKKVEDADVLALLATSTKSKKKASKKKSKGGAEAPEAVAIEGAPAAAEAPAAAAPAQ